MAKFLVTFFIIFGLSLTLSADDFSVGIAYGLHKTRIPIKIMLLMLLGSATSTWGVMLLGKFVVSFIPDWITSWASAIILGAVGCKMIYQGWTDKENYNQFVEKNPLSRSMNPLETYIVGLGLGVDDFAQALGLSVAGFPIILTVILLEVAELIAVLSGNFLAFKGLSKRVNGKLTIIPGIVLILVAIWQLVS